MLSEFCWLLGPEMLQNTWCMINLDYNHFELCSICHVE